MFGHNQAFGNAAAVVAVAAYLCYIRAIVRKTCHPPIASWIAWAAVGIMIAVNYAENGTRESLPITVAYSIFPPVIAWIIFHFQRKDIQFSRLDKIALFVCMASALLWWYFRAYHYAAALVLYANIVIDLAGGVVTIHSAWDRPDEEDILTWFLSTLATTVNMFSVKFWVPLGLWLRPSTWLTEDFAVCIYPPLILIMCASILLTVFFRPKFQAEEKIYG